MRCVRSLVTPCLLTLAVACGDTEPPSDPADGSSSTDDGASSTTPGSSTTAPASEDGPAPESSSDAEVTGDPTLATDPTDATSSDATTEVDTTGGPVNDCTDENDPCTLELDVTASGRGGVDQFFTYVVGAGTEVVRFDGIANDYVSWHVSPWSFLCDATGPCCFSDGAACEKPLVLEFSELAAGDTAYVFVFANAPYELTVASE